MASTTREAIDHSVSTAAVMLVGAEIRNAAQFSLVLRQMDVNPRFS